MGIHLLEFLRLFEPICAAVRSILTFKIEVPTSLARCIAVAFDLAPLAFIAAHRISPGHSESIGKHTTQ